MKTVALVAVALSVATSFALPPKGAQAEKKGKIAQCVPDAVLQKRIYEMTGGVLKRPGVQRGEIVYVNAQKRADRAWIEANANVFAKLTKTAIRVQDGAFDLKKPALVGNATLFVVDDPSLPMSLVAPEAHWAMMNVAAVHSDKPAFFRERVNKQLARVFALLCGGASSAYPGAITGVMTKPEDLDAFADCKLPFDVNARFEPYLAGYGVVPFKQVTYKKACIEGWAPAPTNDIQRAIMEKVKASGK